MLHPTGGRCDARTGTHLLAPLLVFESLRETLNDLIGGRIAPAARRGVIADMKPALVLAKMGVEDLQQGVEVTRGRLATEREALATAERRGQMALGIGDTETAELATKFMAQHAERIAVLERKLEAQEAEHALAEREYQGMVAQLKQANSGVGSGATAESAGPSDEALGLRDDAKLNAELDAVTRQGRRAEKEAFADAALEELKKRMKK